MLRAKKKISQREVQTDKFTTTYFNVQDWYQLNKKNVNIGTTIFALIIIAIVFYYNNLNANNKTSAAELAKLMQFIDAGQHKEAINGIPEKNIRGLLSIVDNDGSSNSGNLAKFYLANSYYSTGEFQKAIEIFEDVDADGNLIESSRLAGLAASFEAIGNFKVAAKYYEQSATFDNTLPTVPNNFFNAAILYGKSGESEKAKKLFDKIKKDFPTSAEARDCERYIAEFASIEK
ncbi:MAG: tetratricopeptide repeat protein [Bacteroidetes bacterium]|nr:tetratricopeptide repeat protein [Bacteroidota bacterium]